MKKTLFAMAALALCGTAVAAEKSTSQLYPHELSQYVPTGDDLTLNVDTTVEFGEFCPYVTSLTLNFLGTNTFSVADGEWNLTEVSLVSVMGDDAAKTSWGNTLLTSAHGEDFKTVTLVSTLEGSPVLTSQTATLVGGSAGEIITLGNAQVTYLGLFNAQSQAEMKLEMNGYGNAVALVDDGYGFRLVGVATTWHPAATPEPATATLSLLALAGMASRRRRK